MQTIIWIYTEKTPKNQNIYSAKWKFGSTDFFFSFFILKFMPLQILQLVNVIDTAPLSARRWRRDR